MSNPAQGAEGADTMTAGQSAYEASIADLRYAPQWSDMTEEDHRGWDRAAAAVLKAACKPWEHYTGEPPDDGSPLSGVFVAGMVYTERLLAKLLGVAHYEGGDGSEDFDADATQTLRNILTGARLWDADENRPVSATPAQPAGAVPDSLRALSEAASAGPFSVSGVRKRYDEASCVIVDAPSCGGLFAFATADGREALAALADAKFVVAAANYVRDLVAGRPAEPWLKKADTVIAEMIAVATAEEGSDLADEWPVDLRAQVDLWQASLQGPLGHHHGFPSRPAPAGQSEDGADIYKIGRQEGYHEGVQDAAIWVGIAGEYRTSSDPERQFPDASKLLERIADHMDALEASIERSTHPATRSAGTEAGWVVANALEGPEQRFRRWGQIGPEWTADCAAALWFARRSDAEAFAAEDEDAWRILPAIASHPGGQSAGSGAEAHTVFDPARTTSDPYDDRPGPWYDMKKVREIEAATGIAFAAVHPERVLGRDTDGLIEGFAAALKAKLRAAEAKYGWQNGWLKNDWAADCQRDLVRHVGKGDPLDVAAYAAFCWHHGWSTSSDSTRTGQAPPGWVLVPERMDLIMIGAFWRWKNTGSDVPGEFGDDRSDAAAYRAMIAARPAAPEAQGTWSFDMEAAPRDGTSVLVAGPSLTDPTVPFVGEAYVDADNGGHWWWAGTSYGDYHAAPLHEVGFKPYAWHPMLDAPAPPASSGQEG